MGGVYGCNINCFNKGCLNSEVSLVPVYGSLNGTSPQDEDFAAYNNLFHNSDFSCNIFKTPEQARAKSLASRLDISKQTNSEKFTGYKSLQNNPKNFYPAIEGILEKYKYSASKYSARWCKLTYKDFRCYKNQWAASTYDRPIFFVYLEQIKKIKVVENRIQKKNPEYFEFEICLYDDETYKNSRKTNEISSKTETPEEIPIDWWNIRESEWDSGTKKFLFGTRNLDIFTRWIRSFNKALHG
jgi:hypothetical protein